MPQTVNAVSCWGGLQGIEPTVSDMIDAIQQKQFFPQLGELIPQSYQQLIERVKLQRTAHPTMQWGEYAALGQASGIKDSTVSVIGGDCLGRKGVLCTPVPLIDEEMVYQVRLEVVAEKAKKKKESKDDDDEKKEGEKEDDTEKEKKEKKEAILLKYETEPVQMKGSDIKGACACALIY
jgi:hypothetical protein